MHHSAKDLTGQRFGCLTAIQRVSGAPTKDRKKSRTAKWLFRCDCGLEVVKDGSEVNRTLKRNGFISAGPCGKKRISEGRTTHGMSSHVAYIAWRNAHHRCRQPNHQSFHNYGGRGITVDPCWETFEAFWADMGPTWKKGLTLERVDNEGNYGPQNCEWVTMEVQARNRRGSLPVSIKDISRKTGVGQSTLRYRWDHGLSMTSSTADPDRVSWSEEMTASRS